MSRREDRNETRRWEHAQLLGEIALLEYELGITDGPPRCYVVMDGHDGPRRIPMATRPDPGIEERR